ncbi:MAG: 6-phosphofructokinase [Alphaproteobacteria bacterium]
MRIAVLTGGGDVPGLNTCIKAVTRAAHARGWEVVGIRCGWAGLLNLDPTDPGSAAKWLIPLTPAAVRTIDRTGGTILHTSRTNPSIVKPDDIPAFLRGRFPVVPGKGTIDCTRHILDMIEHLKIDALIPIGGDGTLSFAARLHGEGVRINSIPKTMDNDVFGTDCCIGFSTAVSRSTEAIQALRTTIGSHERIGVIELFGRLSGETALVTGFLADADRTLIAESPFDIAHLAELIAGDREDNPSRYAIAVISEGAHMKGGGVMERGVADAFGNRKLGGIGEIVASEIHERTGIGTISQNLAYLMRAGAPDALDQMVAKGYGLMAVQLLAEGRTGSMMALRGGNYVPVPVDTCTLGKKRVDVEALYDAQDYRPNISSMLDKPMFLY